MKNRLKYFRRTILSSVIAIAAGTGGNAYADFSSTGESTLSCSNTLGCSGNIGLSAEGSGQIFGGVPYPTGTSPTSITVGAFGNLTISDAGTGVGLTFFTLGTDTTPGAGTLTIRDGATLGALNATIYGTVNITGAGSELTLIGDPIKSGSLINILDGGRLHLTGAGRVSTTPLSQVDILLSGTGSELYMPDPIGIPRAGTEFFNNSRLRVENGAQLNSANAGGVTAFNLTNNSTLGVTGENTRIDLEDIQAEDSTVSVRDGGVINLSGTYSQTGGNWRFRVQTHC